MLINNTHWVDDAGVTTETLEAQPVDLKKKLAEEFRFQAVGCADIGSTVYADLCLVCADDIERGGPVWAALADHAHLRFGLALPLRFLAATHRLALNGDAPQLAAHYVSCGGHPTPSLAADFVSVVNEHRRRVASELGWGVQTNEVVRTAALYPGLAHIASLTGQPLSLREIGTSAGLNLRTITFTTPRGLGRRVIPAVPSRSSTVGENTPRQRLRRSSSIERAATRVRSTAPPLPGRFIFSAFCGLIRRNDGPAPSGQLRRPNTSPLASTPWRRKPGCRRNWRPVLAAQQRSSCTRSSGNTSTGMSANG